jgi:hypothetical protein
MESSHITNSMKQSLSWEDSSSIATQEISRTYGSRGLINSEAYVTTDGQSVSLSWNKAHIWVLRPDFYYCQTVAGLLMYGSLSDERTGLSFIIADGLANAVIFESESGVQESVVTSIPCKKNRILSSHSPIYFQSTLIIYVLVSKIAPLFLVSEIVQESVISSMCHKIPGPS